MNNIGLVHNGKMGCPKLNTDRNRSERIIGDNLSECRLAKEHDRNNTWSNYHMIKPK